MNTDKNNKNITKDKPTKDNALAKKSVIKNDKKPEKKTFDKYKREILDNNFENILRMSKNSVKLNYSSIKNFIHSYKYIKSKFDGEKEFFQKGNKILFILKIGSDRLLVYCRLPENSLDKSKYPHREIKNKEFNKTPVMLTVQSPNSSEKAKEVIEITMEVNELEKAKVPVKKAYAQMYPINKNAVLKGQEDKPPIKGQYDKKEYENIQNEIVSSVVKKATKGRDPQNKDKSYRKQTAKTVNEAIALAEPVVFYYDVALDSASEVIFVNSQMVLNDKFLGKMLPQHYQAIAESSDRIEKLDLLKMEMAAKDCELKPDRQFLISVSCRHLTKKDKLKKLIKAAQTQNGNLILSFDSVYLNALGNIGKEANKQIKAAGIKFSIDNGEQANIEVLTEYFLDYIRLDARYYPLDNPKAIAHLDMITGYTKVQGINAIMTNVEGVRDALKYLSHGINGVQGTAVSHPKRLVNVAIKDRKNLPNKAGG